MNFSAERAVTLLVGASGTGKTTFAIRLLTAGDYVCRFAFDWDGQLARRTGLRACFDAPSAEAALASGWVLLDPNRSWPGRHGEAFDWFAAWAFEASGRGPGRKLLLVDEVWRYCDNWKIPPSLATCIQTGRVRELDLCFATQRPARLNEGITGEATELVCFRTAGSNNLRVIQSLGGDAETVSKLHAFEFVSWNLLREGCVRGRVR